MQKISHQKANSSAIIIGNPSNVFIVTPEDARDSKTHIPAELKDQFVWMAPTGLTPIVTFPEANNFIVAEFFRIRENIGPNESRLYDFRTGNAEMPLVSIWGSTVLDTMWDQSADKIKPGDLLFVQYQGTVETSRKQNPAKLWAVGKIRKPKAEAEPGNEKENET